VSRTSANFSYDMRVFAAGLQELRRTSRRDLDAALMTQARGFVRTVIDITPPGSKNRRGLAARRQGDRAVRRDVLRVVAPSRKRGIAAPNIRAAVDARRVAGRVPRAAPKKISAPSAAVTAEIRRRQRRVGWLASGWREAAALTGVRLPAWVARHQAPSAAQVQITPHWMRIRMTNGSPWASDVAGLERRVQWALNIQGVRMLRSARNYYARKARRAQFAVAA
jgi:hypothetical protein